MLTTTKLNSDDKKFELSTVYFLTKEGNETNETPVLNNNTYVSVEDYNKYGKVEVYSDGKQIRQEYFLKQYRGGRSGELLVDPYGMFSKSEDLSAFVNQKGHRFCEYVKVPSEVYHSYVNYLQSRDVRYFRYAEKAVLDKVV